MSNEQNEGVTVPAIQDGGQAGRAREEGTSWMGLLINAAMSLAIVAAALLAYHFTYVVPNKQRLAVLDIAGILQLKELEVTAKAVHPDATDAQRGEAFEIISKFAGDMEHAIAELQQECGCTLLVKAAVVKAAGAEDLTPVLKQRMNMGSLDEATLLKEIRSAGGQGQSPVLRGQK